MMKTKITNKVKMYKSVLEVCKKHEDDWVGIPGFVSAIEKFETGLITLKAISESHEKVLAGVSNAKNANFNGITEALKNLHDALWIVGNLQNDYPLMARNKFSLTKIKRISAGKIDAYLSTLIEDANANSAQILDFGISAVYLAEILEKIEITRISFTRPRMAIIERKMLTNKIEAISTDLDNILRLHVDRMIRLFKSSKPDFFHLYFNARVIIDLHGKAKGKIKPIEPENDELF
jgi:hypothetical protein